MKVFCHASDSNEKDGERRDGQKPENAKLKPRMKISERASQHNQKQVQPSTFPGRQTRRRGFCREMIHPRRPLKQRWSQSVHVEREEILRKEPQGFGLGFRPMPM